MIIQSKDKSRYIDSKQVLCYRLERIGVQYIIYAYGVDLLNSIELGCYDNEKEATQELNGIIQAVSNGDLYTIK